MTSITIEDGGLTDCGSNWNSQGWIHEATHKLYLVESGTGRYAIPGHEVALSGGRLYLIPGGRRHDYGAAHDLRVHWLHLRVLSPAVERHLGRLGRILDWPLERWAWWQQTWQAIPAWFARRDLAGELRLQAFAAAVIAEALAGVDDAEGPDPRMAEALRWMEAHCLQHPSLAAAARVAGSAPAVFHRRFVASFACTPRAWLETRRLDHARRLLRERSAAVQEVAAACGYANPFHFARVVRRRLGQSPSQLRQRRGP